MIVAVEFGFSGATWLPTRTVAPVAVPVPSTGVRNNWTVASPSNPEMSKLGNALMVICVMPSLLLKPVSLFGSSSGADGADGSRGVDGDRRAGRGDRRRVARKVELLGLVNVRPIGDRPRPLLMSAIGTVPPAGELTLLTWTKVPMELIVTVGAEVYPDPPLVTLIAVTTPFTTVALAVAPLPPPPESVTCGVNV